MCVCLCLSGHACEKASAHAQLTRVRCRRLEMMSYCAETSDCDCDGQSCYADDEENNGEGQVNSMLPLTAR